MNFQYSFTREEYISANSQYVKKTTQKQSILAIISVCLFGVMVAVVFVNYFVTHYSVELPAALALFFALIALVLFAVVRGYRISSVSTVSACFDCYNIDGLLRYDIELAETELVIKCKQNVSHVPLSALSNVESLESYAFVLFKTNVLLVVKINDDTKLLVNSLRGVLPTNS